MENEKIADQKEFEQVNKFGMGQPNVAYAKYFSGASFSECADRTWEISDFRCECDVRTGM